MNNKIKIGVTCVGSVVGQGIIRSIQRSALADDVKIVGFDYFQDVPGARWVDSFHVMPDILDQNIEEEKYISALIGHLKAENIKILFVGIGFELPMMAKFKERIETETGCVVVVSDTRIIATALDKYKTFLFLKDNALSYPKTWLPKDKNDVLFPAIVKPRRGTGSKGLSFVNSKQELQKALSNTNNPVIQENVGTQDEEYTCGVVFMNGELKSSICLRRYLKSGNTNIAIHSKELPNGLSEYVADVASKLRPFGPANFQIRIAKDGAPKLFEINPRFSGTTGARSLFGVNEVEIIMGVLLGKPVEKRKKTYGKIVKYLEDILIPE
jgi:carbamoyl-phosphate synthase large subunit